MQIFVYYRMKTTNISVSLDTRRVKKDNTFPIILRIGHNGRTTSINLGYSVKNSEWDDSKKIVTKQYKGTETVTRLNNFIQKTKAHAMDVILKLHERNELQQLTVIEIKERIVNHHSRNSFLDYGNQVVADLRLAHRMGTARSYAGVLKILQAYCNHGDISFQQITHSFLSQFEISHREHGSGTNSLGVYMRTIRAMYNRAIKDGLVERELYPFEYYKIKTAPTQKRALDAPLLAAIIQLQLEPSNPLFNTRNYFVASYMMYGMNFTDMAYLEKSDIIDGRIHYRRKKTGKVYDIKITEGLQKILSFYISQKPENDYVFPIIKRESSYEKNEDIIGARKRYNKKLKQLAIACEISQNLTSYVSRHTYATQAMLHQIPLNAISTMLGHSSLKTTEVYLKSLPSTKLDEYNALVLNQL